MYLKTKTTVLFVDPFWVALIEKQRISQQNIQTHLYKSPYHAIATAIGAKNRKGIGYPSKKCGITSTEI